MANAVCLAYNYKGNLASLQASVKKSCEKMTLILKEEKNNPNGFSVIAAQKTNWLSTNWPIKFLITAEAVGETYALVIEGASTIGSITQAANNSAKGQELLSLIQAYAPSA